MAQFIPILLIATKIFAIVLQSPCNSCCDMNVTALIFKCRVTLDNAALASRSLASKCL